MGELTNYKITQEEEEELDLKLRGLLEYCQILGIPFFASCAIENDESGTKYLNTVYSPQAHAIKLRDDKIRKHMLIANGNFDIVPKREIMDFTPLGVVEGKKDL